MVKGKKETKDQKIVRLEKELRRQVCLAEVLRNAISDARLKTISAGYKYGSRRFGREDPYLTKYDNWLEWLWDVKQWSYTTKGPCPEGCTNPPPQNFRCYD